MQGRGLKPGTSPLNWHGNASPLMQGRGLKPGKWAKNTTKCMSPLMQGRGLKQATKKLVITHGHVAPYAGAWIETTHRHQYQGRKKSPLMQGRGLKL